MYCYFGSVVDGVDQVLKNVIRIIMTKMKNKDAAKNRKNKNVTKNATERGGGGNTQTQTNSPNPPPYYPEPEGTSRLTRTAKKKNTKSK